MVNSANWRLGGGTLPPHSEEDEEISENSSSSEFNDDEDEETAPLSNYNPMRASQVTRRTKDVLSAAESLMRCQRHWLTESKQQELGFHLGDLREIRQDLVVLIERYQADSEILISLLDLLENVNSALERLGVNLQEPSGSNPSASVPSPSSVIIERSTVETLKEDEMIDMRSTMKLSQLYELNDGIEATLTLENDPSNNNTTNIGTSSISVINHEISLGDCSMCWEDMMESNSRELECGHRFCDGCLSHYLKVLVDEAKVICIKCPHQECSEEMYEEDMEDLLEESDFARLQQLVFLTQIRQDLNARWCPRPGCKTVCRLSPTTPFSSSSSRSVDVVQRLVCGTCQFIFCSGCGMEYHPKMSCKRKAKKSAQQDKKLIGRRAAKEKKLSIKSMKLAGFTKCPGCNAFIEKDSGCNHMTCLYVFFFLLSIYPIY